ncbi:MAG: T9SS type A sorting domain-containing protein [Bacteroidota bacterium]
MNLNGSGTSVSGTGTITSTSSGDSVNVTNDKTILSGSEISIGSSINEITVILNGEMELTNNGAVKIFGGIEGNNPLSSWVNEANSILEITGSLLNTGTLNTNASPNSVNYNGSGAQTIKAPYNNNYYNLLASNAGVKTLDSDIVVTNALTIQDASILDENIFAITGNASLAMSGTTELRLERSTGGTYPELTGLYSITGGTITVNQTSGTAILKGANYFNLKFTGSRPYDISAISNVDNNFDIQGSSSLINTTNLSVIGEFNYASSGSSRLSGNLTASAMVISNGTFDDGGYTITVNGNGGWTLDGGTFSSTGITVFTGGSAQEIGGSLSTVFNILNINNIGGVTLNLSPANATILSNSLILNSGILHTSSGNLIRLLDNTVSGIGSSSSYVDGPMVKVGNDDFIFPLGKSGRWRRAAISSLSNSITEVTAEYFAGPYSSLTPLSDSLTQISDIEYWDIDRTVTSDSLKLRLFWENATASDIINCDYLSIAHWKSGQWEKEASVVAGGSSCTGSGSGSIETESWISSFSPFSFGGSGGQALPVSLLSFDAFPEDEIVKTNWVTELEINNNYFAVERSADAVNFNEVVRLIGAGNSTEVKKYEAVDQHPLSGVSYYRLRQVDFDGQYSYSKVVSVKRVETSSLSLYPNPTDNELSLSVTNPSAEIRVVIYDLSGREMYAQVFASDSFSNPQTVNVSAKYLLPTGIYMVTASTNGKMFREKVILR